MVMKGGTIVAIDELPEKPVYFRRGN